MASDSTPNPSTTPAGPPPVARGVFVGPKGLRTPWRILIFVGIVAGLVVLLPTLAALIRPFGHFLQGVRADQIKGNLTPLDGIVSELFLAVPILVAATVMALIEKRSLADYGLPLNQAFGKRFWQGVPLGFVMLSVLLAAISALHGFSLNGFAVSGVSAVKYGLLWAVVFFLTGVAEDFGFRGYLQSALGAAIGFWPAALILAVAFGAVHWNNQGEALFGCVMAGVFGLVSVFSLRRTGNLWFSIGMHMSWDWSETYFYGTPDSGLVASGHLLNSSFHGPQWLAGGTVGPEGSWLVLPTLLLWALVIHFLFPAKRPTT